MPTSVPESKRARRRIWWRKPIRQLALVSGLFALLWLEENLRGKYSWEHYRHQMEASGEPLSLAGFIPPPVPDDQNFAMTPFLAPLYDFRSDWQLSESDSPAWRDPEAVARTKNFFTGIHGPDSIDDNLRDPRVVDLIGWALAFQDAAALPQSPPTNRTAAAVEILSHLQKYGPVLDELRLASHRAFARFKIRYQDGMMAQLPHLDVLKFAADKIMLRALAELELNQTDEALADIQMIHQLSNKIREDPFWISSIVRQAIVPLQIQPTFEGLAHHRWSDSQLIALQQSFEGFDFLADFRRSSRYARTDFNDFFESLRQHRLAYNGNTLTREKLDFPPTWLPSGWLYQNQVFINRMIQDRYLALVDPVAQRVDPQVCHALVTNLSEIHSSFAPYRIAAKLVLYFPYWEVQKTAFVQTTVNQAILACALERYHLAHGRFPETLDALMPEYVQQPPHDLINGQPLKYRRLADDGFLIYSVGWNGRDDEGTGQPNKSPGNYGFSRKLDTGDWVWCSAVSP